MWQAIRGPRWLVAVFLTVGLAATPAWGAEVYGRGAADLGLYLGNNLLAAWRVAEARAVVDELLEERPEDANARFLDAHVLFFEGHYAASLAVLNELDAAGEFTELVRATERATRDFSSRRSEHFEVFWGNPRDEVLVEPALAGLEAAHAALAERLDFVPEGVVRVEIYPTAESFTQVSTLTRKEVETSGTIGLCKFDRIMITSPRVTLWGYSWRDTLAHEYVHLAVYRLTHGSAPIWVHEGVAKYLEPSWRGVVGELEPSSQVLLARRFAADDLISLEAMSPSVAKLPSAEDTALAFAEVATMMTFLTQERGADAVRRLVEAMGERGDDRAALEAVWDDSFASFESAWRAWVAGLPLETRDAQVIGLHLADEGDVEEEPGHIPDPKARDFVRLGDLLAARDRLAAAGAEYRKAYELAPEAPGIASRHARGLLWQGDNAGALSVAEQALELYPDLAVLWYRRGLALLELARYQEALAVLEQLLEYNPFHVPGRRALLHAAEQAGDDALVAREQWALALLSPADGGDPHQPAPGR